MRGKESFKFNVSRKCLEKFDQEVEGICLALNAEFLRYNIRADYDNEVVYISLLPSVAKSLERSIYKYINDGDFIANNLAQSFNTDLMVEEYSTFLNTRYEELLNQASKNLIRAEHNQVYENLLHLPYNLGSFNILNEINDYNAFDIINNQTVNKYKYNNSANTNTMTNNNVNVHILSALFQNSDKVIIGEDHGHYAPKQFIIDNIEYLKQISAIIVIENMTQELQSEIDICVKEKQYTSLIRYGTPVINTSFPTDKEQGAINLKYKMIQLLCQKGITIIGGSVESPLLDTNFKERQLIGAYSMIMNVEQYIEKNPDHKDKPILYFVGSKHAKSERFTIGIAERVGGISCIIEDNEKLDEIIIERNIYHSAIKMKSRIGTNTAAK